MRNYNGRTLAFNLSPSCGVMTGGATISCTPPGVGTKDLHYLIPFANWQAAAKTYSATNPNVLTSFGLHPQGEDELKAFLFEGIRNSVAPKETFKQGTYFGQYNHSMDFIVMKPDHVQVRNLEALNNTRCVHVYIDGDNNIRVAGWNSGLLITKNDRDPLLKDLGNSHSISATSGEGEEIGYPLFFGTPGVSAPYAIDPVAALIALKTQMAIYVLPE